jgi:hypothetical protein
VRAGVLRRRCEIRLDWPRPGSTNPTANECLFSPLLPLLRPFPVSHRPPSAAHRALLAAAAAAILSETARKQSAVFLERSLMKMFTRYL